MNRSIRFLWVRISIVVLVCSMLNYGGEAQAGNVAQDDPLSPCDLTKDMVGQQVWVLGEIGFVDNSLPDGTFVELSSGGCRVGAFIHANILSEFGAEGVQAIEMGKHLEVEGRLSTFGGDLEIEVDRLPGFLEGGSALQDPVPTENTPPTEPSESAPIEGETPCDMTPDRVGEMVTVTGVIEFMDTNDPMGVFVGIQHQGCFVGAFLDKDVWNGLPADKQAAYQVGEQVTVSGNLSSLDGELVVEVLGEYSEDGSIIPELDLEAESLCNLTVERIDDEVIVSGMVTEFIETDFGYSGHFTNHEIRTGYYTTNFTNDAGICAVRFEAFREEVDAWPEETRQAFFEGQEAIIGGRLVLATKGIDPNQLIVAMFGPPEITGQGELDLPSKVEPGWYNKINVFDTPLGGFMPGFTAVEIGESSAMPGMERMVRQTVINFNAAGIPYGGTVYICNTGDPRALEQHPELADAIALNIDGEYVLDWGVMTPLGAPQAGCTLHPAWLAYQKEQVRLLVDVGVNNIFFDCPGASGRTTVDRVDNGDFNPVTMEAFRIHLKETYSESQRSDIADIDSFNYKDWLIEKGYADQVRNTDLKIRFKVPLWGEFVKFLASEDVKMVAELLTYTHDYIDQQGRQDVAVAVNVNDHGAGTLPVMDLMDYYYQEFYYFRDYPPIARNAPIIRIGNAWGKPSVFVPGSGFSVPRLFEFESTTVLFKTWIAESYANGSMFEVPSGYGGALEQPGGGTLLEVYVAEMDAIQPYYEFIMANQACCSEKLVLPDVTLVYHAPSDIEDFDIYRPLFLEASQALLENNIQYNVLFLNGDVQAGELLTPIVVVPVPEVPFTPEEQAAFEGATVISYDQNSTSEDLTQDIFAQLQPVIKVDQPGVEAYLFEHEGQFVINLVNQTYQVETETVTDIEDITITLHLPDDRGVDKLQLLSPDGDVDSPLEFQQDGDVLAFTVPYLHVWDLIIID